MAIVFNNQLLFIMLSLLDIEFPLNVLIELISNRVTRSIGNRRPMVVDPESGLCVCFLYRMPPSIHHFLMLACASH